MFKAREWFLFPLLAHITNDWFSAQHLQEICSIVSLQLWSKSTFSL